ncbi:uncharacterized protein L3040_008640 [Drepanopeziza brunnea f. sp. 'multigermtubi']|uniref:Ubiquitin-conjugating enzyme E2 2 n=1 Tax=Marssonina brunnea f. sp. multigermtubi (strain MB_m1) TaxID=1072389 RepID=K1WXX6_MARBU|nr:ubiquitin-conjugating enzyme [Drepanopeziza brunnea f. sp. 'multigermtubi' MB_m1]EKD13493.1 ubiquitin-conjugating enzyme [Drepanopeziza brunnea f. sp. 'multigermtubi' MB_m1]KAJ5033525.1 hypothetical protein L3040_008640 [Drepanopeziza brunnea f. sp. 'multigermtubi']
MSNAAGAKGRLMSEYKSLEKEKWVKIDLKDGSLFKWNVNLIVVNSESAFDGAYLKCEMSFTENYPYSPPKFKFLQPIYHPNIYPDGKVCISILHAPGEDEQSGELASERWSSIQSVESVLRSILLLLDDPEISSPANVDAGVLYRDNREEYNRKAKDTVTASKKDIPEGFVMPTTLIVAPPPKIVEDDDFWNESGDEDDFGASDSSGEDIDMDEDEEEEEEL